MNPHAKFGPDWLSHLAEYKEHTTHADTQTGASTAPRTTMPAPSLPFHSLPSSPFPPSAAENNTFPGFLLITSVQCLCNCYCYSVTIIMYIHSFIHSFIPSLYFPFPLLSPFPLFPKIKLGSVGERCELPSGVRGGARPLKNFGYILSPEIVSGGTILFFFVLSNKYEFSPDVVLEMSHPPREFLYSLSVVHYGPRCRNAPEHHEIYLRLT